MNRYSYNYKKSRKKNIKLFLRIVSALIFLSGVFTIIYVSFPFAFWHIYFAPVFASQFVNAPIPKTNVIGSSLIKTKNGEERFIDYTNAKNWFPNVSLKPGNPRIDFYTISIPKLNIVKAVVSTKDTNLSSHLVHYDGTAIPPDNGNAVIFGHSTLPQLFNPKDYKTIFANAYLLKPDDEIYIFIHDVKYSYKIYNTIVVDPEETSIFSQDYSASNLTLITCTPPGTTWKRLIIKAAIENI